MTTNTTHTPSEMIAHFRELHDAGEITAREKQVALKRWVTKGKPWITRGGVKYTWTPDSIGCTCGKGIYCPAVTQRPA